MLPNFRNTSYKRLGDFPSNGVFTTRFLLEVFLFNFAVGIMLAVASLYAEEILWIALVFCAISFLIFVWVLWRIFRFYRLLRRQEASGIPFNPDENLSLDNYMRVLFFLDPKGYTINVTRPESLAEVEQLDEPVANNDIEDAVLGAPAGDSDLARIENPVFDPAAIEIENIENDLCDFVNAVLHAPSVYGIPDYDEMFANNVDEASAADDDILFPHDNVECSVLGAPISEY